MSDPAIPVEPDDTRYELLDVARRKRRRQMLVAAAAILLALSGGLGVSLWQMNRAIDAEQIAGHDREARDAARQSQPRATQAAQQARAGGEPTAEREPRTPQETKLRLGRIEKEIELLAGLDPDDGEKAGPAMSEQLRRRAELAADQLDAESAGDPLTVARLQTTLGKSLQRLGSYEKAIALLEKARRTREARLGDDHPDTLITMNKLAFAYRAAGQVSKAASLYEETLKRSEARLGNDHPETITTMHNLALAYKAAGQLDKALRLYEETLKRSKAALGDDHPETLRTMNNLALAYDSVGRLDKALPLYEETLKRFKATLGDGHPDTLITMDNLAGAYYFAGELEKALQLFEETLKQRSTRLGDDHPDTLLTMDNLAIAYKAAGQLGKALPLYEETLKRQRSSLGDDHPDTLMTMNNLALGYYSAGQLDKALPLYEATVERQRVRLGANHPGTLITMGNFATAYKAAGQFDKALPLFEAVATGFEKLRFAHPQAAGIMGNVIQAFEEAGEFDKAESWRRKWLEVVRRKAGAESAEYATELSGLGDNLLHQQKFVDAEAMLRQCLAIRQEQQPDDWTTFNTMSTLGGALQGRAGKTDDADTKSKLLAAAEPLLREGYAGMQARADAIPASSKSSLTRALDRLIDLATALDHPDDLARWKAEKEKLGPQPEK